ncbi:hypothetical protein PHMEG_00021220 [Phytophthora megakarya]|uniref:Uncharacterized protein n=1 Tax=Phytophthora megakarya TaxID=4795 RepID=A0A225VN23_9STRA|nr:hypothetical protein PHMEG_00021220 [Phytophthora megakarya]
MRETPYRRLGHVQFRIDNTSAVGWQNNMGYLNPRPQTIIHLLGASGFQSAHVAGPENTIADADSPGQVGRDRIRPGLDLAHYLRTHSVAASTCGVYRKMLHTWFEWSTHRDIQPTLIGVPATSQVQSVTDFVLHGFQCGTAPPEDPRNDNRFDLPRHLTFFSGRQPGLYQRSLTILYGLEGGHSSRSTRTTLGTVTIAAAQTLLQFHRPVEPL